jgi:hypothetical protein
METEGKFATERLDKQRERMEKYAQEIIDANDEAAQLAMEAQQEAMAAMDGGEPQPADAGIIEEQEIPAE